MAGRVEIPVYIMVFNDKAMRYYTLILCVLFIWTINKVSDSLGRSDFQQARSLYHGFLRSSLFVVIDVYITSPLNSGLFFVLLLGLCLYRPVLCS